MNTLLSFASPAAGRRLPGLLTLILPLLFSLSTLAAAPTKIFVASYGNDANDGSRGAPKRNFQAAHDAVAATGEIVPLDTAGYGQLTITKSVTVTAPPGVSGFVTVSGAVSAIYVNAGTTDTVVLRGLIIEGSGNAGTGIYSTHVGTLRIEDVKIRNLFNGIYIVNSVFSPSLTMHRCDIGDVRYGISIDGSATGITYASVTDCTIDHCEYYAIVSTGSGTNINMRHCVLTNSGRAAFSAPSSGVVRVGTSTVTGNFRTVDTDNTPNRGAVVSYGDNLVSDFGGVTNFYGSLGQYQ